MTGRPKRGRRVALAVTGSIAAYKAAEIARGLVKAGAEVRCVLTPTAAKFVSPLTLSVLCRHPVYENAADPALWEMAHLSLAAWADRVVVAPATADMLARLAAGRAEGLVDALVLSCERGAVAVAPAMDNEMWEHPATVRNIEILKSYGYGVWGPGRGPLASGKVGWGRLLEPAEIVRRCLV